MSQTKQPPVELYTRSTSKAVYKPKPLEKIELEQGEVIVGYHLRTNDQDKKEPIDQLGFVVWRPLTLKKA